MPSSSPSALSSQFTRRPKHGAAAVELHSPPPAAAMRPREAPAQKLERGVRYGECRRNHAATIGGYAVDGCREFMASGEEGTSAALHCAACSCHRNFHKKEVEVPEADSLCDCSSISS